MMRNLKLLINFVDKFLETVKFRNDQIAPILGYGDLVQGSVTIKRVYYVEGLNHNLFSVGQFCDADLEVAFRKSMCYIRDLKRNDLLIGTEFLNKTLHAYFAAEGILHQTSVARTPKQNSVVERRNRTLVEAARTMLSAAKIPLFFWAEAISASCFTQNRSLVIPRHKKIPYHIINDRKPLLGIKYTRHSHCQFTTSGIKAWRETLILGEFPSIHISLSLFKLQKEMDHQYPTVAKIPVLDTRKFKQWQFWMQQYLQHKHYALWEVIKFDNSYKVPVTVDPNDANTTSGADAKSGRTVTITTEGMQRKKNDVKARTTLLLSLLDEHQLRNMETSKQRDQKLGKMFNRLQVIVGQLQFMDVEVEKDDLNQKFLTSLAPEWLMHTIVWRNRNDLDTMSQDYLYNHLKVYEAEVQKMSNLNSQNMAFISSSKHSSEEEDGNTACVSTASTTFPTASASIDEDDMEEMDIKWSMVLLSMRADKFWKRTGKKISIQGSDVAGFDKSKVDCFNCHKMGHFARDYMENKGEDHALVADAEAPTEFALMANTESNVFDNSLCSKDCKKNNDSLNRYNVVPPSAADLYLSPKKDLSWTGLPKFVDDTVTDYSRPSPTVASTSAEGQNKNSTTSEDVASPNTPNPFGSSQNNIDDKGYWNSGCSRHMTGNISYLFDFEPFDGGYVPFGQGGCKITGKGTIKTGKLEFENVYFVKDLKYNLFNVSQICDNKNNVLFTDSECIVLGRNFKLLDDANILLRTPRQHNIESNLKSIESFSKKLDTLKLEKDEVDGKLAGLLKFSKNLDNLIESQRKRVQREITRSQNHVYMRPPYRSAGHRPHGAPMKPPHRSAGHRPHGLQ
nr:ribonuclease H-like domain-containing protein [Tanacetum cinerariifolium]